MRPRRLLVLVLLITTLVPLSAGTFFEPDEGRYSEIARGMLVSGD